MKTSLPLPAANVAPEIAKTEVSSERKEFAAKLRDGSGKPGDFARQLSRAARKESAGHAPAAKRSEPTPPRKTSTPGDDSNPDDLAIACSARVLHIDRAQPASAGEEEPLPDSASRIATEGSEPTPVSAPAVSEVAKPENRSPIANLAELAAAADLEVSDSAALETFAEQFAQSASDGEAEVHGRPNDASSTESVDETTASFEPASDGDSLEQNLAHEDLLNSPASNETPPPKGRRAGDRHSQSSTITAQTSSSLAGTAAANHAARMIDVVETDKTAGQMEKDLPGDLLPARLPAAKAAVADDARSSLRRDFEPHGIALQVTSPAFSAQPDAKVETASPSMSDQTVERVARALLDGVARVRHSDEKSVTVTITPQPGTELSLRVELRDGNISAHLQFERGDRQLVDANWQELQRRMADQGVQLHRGDDSGARTGGSFQQNFSQSQRREQAQLEETILQKPPTRGAEVPKSFAAPRISRSMLERWA